ncbi:sigma-70 family RNA polymerase sigma factor [Telmatocola sphagniphila]|uniref:Sigma-70 family RNA polymerase sigma factor n=1 Tax=Telmatocola sphagniphila TaxID=1123043 RepID=A0A8E6B4P9_9BACT|nr:sigma-70 family RNA polymerase sigma factor [Telmatocola sphagniphila]QVL31292.1 sigma-70 family RNA polymerase sigma factor [Telmatocola sphagniphila]
MSSETSSRLQQFIRRLREEAVPPEDGCLWDRYVQTGDQHAFEILVYRHGPMVLACAYRMLSNRTDSEDVFQATFLSLARSKHRIRDSKALSSWLYKTTFRSALKLRNRTRPTEQLLEETLSSDGNETDLAWREVKGALDEELQKLPERLRLPLLLCYLQGLSRDEAAKQLGWSFTLLKRRLEEGRRVLRVRLERRGISAAGLALAVLLPQALQAMVSPTLVNSCLALIFCKETTVPAAIAALTLTTSAITKGLVMKAIATTVLCAGLGIWSYTTMGQGIGLIPPEKGINKGVPGTLGDSSQAENAPQERTASNTQQLRSLNNLKQIAIAILNYEAAYGYLPADTVDQDGKALLSWRIELLPYLGRADLYNQFKRDQAWDSEHNLKLLAKMPDVYRVGFEAKDSTHTYYQVFAGPNTPLHPMLREKEKEKGKGPPGALGLAGNKAGAEVAGPGATGPVGSSGPGAGMAMGPGAGMGPMDPRIRIRIADIFDGTSNTIGVVEAGPAVPWTKPADIPFDPTKPLPKNSTPFTNSFHLTMIDGTTHAIRPNIDPKILKDFIGMNDGAVLPRMSSFHAEITPPTPTEKAELQKRIEQNGTLLEKMAALQSEQRELLGKINHGSLDIIAHREVADLFEKTLKQIQAENQQLKAIIQEIEKQGK